MTKKLSYKNQKKILNAMIGLYCRKKHGGKGELCAKCRELSQYSNKRLELCKWGDDKPLCSHCTAPCYSPEMKQEIKKVMRFSGPRMLFYHPIIAIKHGIIVIREKSKQE